METVQFSHSVSGDLSGPSYILDSTHYQFNNLPQFFHVKIYTNLDANIYTNHDAKNVKIFITPNLYSIFTCS